MNIAVGAFFWRIIVTALTSSKAKAIETVKSSGGARSDLGLLKSRRARTL
jgi:hypothetical protein